MLWDELKLLQEGDEITYRRAAVLGGGLDTSKVVGFTEGAALIPSKQCIGVKIAIKARDIVAARHLANGKMEQVYIEPGEHAVVSQRFVG
jgi:hypothetical protein